MSTDVKFNIRTDDLSHPKVLALLQAHLDDAYARSPAETVQALDLEALRKPEIIFWTLWDNDDLLGCGALKELNQTHGEIKSMHTSLLARRRGVARQLVAHIAKAATERGYTRLSLETGANPPFAAARALYESIGFTRCPPFSHYKDGPYSLCMSMPL